MANEKKPLIVGVAAVIIIGGSTMTALGELDPVLPATHSWVQGQLQLANKQQTRQLGEIQGKIDKMLQQMKGMQRDVLTGDLRYLNGQMRLIKERLVKTPNDMLLLQQQDDTSRQIEQLEEKLRLLQ